MNFCEKMFRLGQNVIFFYHNFLKTFKFVVMFGPPFVPAFPRFGMSCDVDSGTRDFKLDPSRLFYLCKFSFVIHSKCRKGALLLFVTTSMI